MEIINELCEALKSCVDEMCDRCRELAAARGNPLPCLSGCEPVRKAKIALAKPVRNCDVGTADEQAERFEDFCLKHIGCAEETGGRHCVGCPLEKASMKTTQKCELYWAQMPYEEGGGE